MGEIKEFIIKCKRVEKSGKKFPIYMAKAKDGTWVKAKFRSTCTNAPTDAGTYNVAVPVDKCNIAQDFFGDVLWIQEVVSVAEHVAENGIDERF